MKNGRNRIITFTTDFGTGDHYAAVMKGVALAVNHRITCIDVTHGIAPGDVAAGAFTVAAAYRWFPAGTIHVAVVDPGVGTGRRALVVRAGGHTFVGPDNGIFSHVLRRHPDAAVHAVTNKKYLLASISKTFHGRDVFAPVAAWLSKGVKPVRMGRTVTDAVLLADTPVAVSADGRVTAPVLHVDRYGNVITALAADALPAAWTAAPFLTVNGTQVPLADAYAAAAPGTLLAIAGSSGYLELAVNGGSAASLLKVTCGDRVELAAGPA